MTKSDEYIWKVESYLMKRYGVDAMHRMVDPLRWYVNTGRASATFLINMYGVQPYCIGKILAKGGSHDEVIKKIRKRLGFPEVTY